MVWVLEQLGGGPEEEARVLKTYPLLAGSFIVGRKEDCDIPIRGQKSISRHHATIIVGELTTAEIGLLGTRPPISVVDKNSKYTTKVGDIVLQPDVPHQLMPGDTIRFGVAPGVRVTDQRMDVCMSRVSGKRADELKGAAAKVGAHLVDQWHPKCTHLVVDKVVIATSKVLSAIVHGCPVVEAAWLEALAQRTSVASPLPSPGSFGPDWSKVKMQRDLGQDRRNLYNGIRMVFLQKDELEELVAAAGGEVIKGYEITDDEYMSVLDTDGAEAHLVVLDPSKPNYKSRVDLATERSVGVTTKHYIAKSVFSNRKLMDNLGRNLGSKHAADGTQQNGSQVSLAFEVEAKSQSFGESLNSLQAESIASTSSSTAVDAAPRKRPAEDTAIPVRVNAQVPRVDNRPRAAEGGATAKRRRVVQEDEQSQVVVVDVDAPDHGVSDVVAKAGQDDGREEEKAAGGRKPSSARAEAESVAAGKGKQRGKESQSQSSSAAQRSGAAASSSSSQMPPPPAKKHTTEAVSSLSTTGAPASPTTTPATTKRATASKATSQKPEPSRYVSAPGEWLSINRTNRPYGLSQAASQSQSALRHSQATQGGGASQASMRVGDGPEEDEEEEEPGETLVEVRNLVVVRSLADEEENVTQRSSANGTPNFKRFRKNDVKRCKRPLFSRSQLRPFAPKESETELQFRTRAAVEQEQAMEADKLFDDDAGPVKKRKKR